MMAPPARTSPPSNTSRCWTLQQRIESIADGADLDEVYSTERHLLYVAATRARDHLIVSCVAPGSEFLDDLTASG
jgi:ATP-dependent exoDNAse (exonuclease V) beta subunit